MTLLFLGQGFRNTNNWLSGLPHHNFSTNFYGGDTWGSFNAWMRLVTGVVFGLRTSWFLFPHLNDAFKNFKFGLGFRGGTEDSSKQGPRREVIFPQGAGVEFPWGHLRKAISNQMVF